MIALFLIPMLLAVSAYLYFRLIRWLSSISPLFSKKPIMIVIGAIILIFTLMSYVSYPMRGVGIGRILKQLGHSWNGLVIYSLMVILPVDIIGMIINKIRKKNGLGGFSSTVKIVTGAICLTVITGLLTYGFVNARIVRTTEYDISIDKQAGSISDLNVVLISDLHMGINVGCSHIRDMAAAVNELEPDIILVAGDIFDNDYDSLDDPEELISILRTMKARYGVYCVFGNHDIDEKLLNGFSFNFKAKKVSDERMDRFVEECGWTRLSDQGVMIDDSFYLYGRPDRKKPGRGITDRKTPTEITEDIDPSVPVIVLEHEPAELRELAAAGVDVDLCGHTHGGQFFPMTFSNRFSWKNGYGLKDVDGMKNIVTSGVGVYGIYMRVGSHSEVVHVNIHFSK